MEIQTTLGESSARARKRKINHYENSVGNNLQSVQITTKYRYKMMGKEKNEELVRIAVEEACKRHKISIEILSVQREHVHFIVDCPRTLSVSKMMQLIKGFSAYLIFRMVPGFRLRYPKGHFWSEGYFCESCGSDFALAYSYVENQDVHHHFG